MKKYLYLNLYDGGVTRNKEFALCLEKNRRVFDKVVVLSDGQHYDGVTNVTCRGEATVERLIAEANGRTDGETVNVVANGDVWFENTRLLEKTGTNEMWALTRWERGTFFCREDSADAWVWKGPIRVRGCNFRLGLRGTDNALAARAEAAGYVVSNPSLDVRIWHEHSVRRENRMYAPMPYDMCVRPGTTDRRLALFVTSINPFDRQAEQKEAVGSWLKADGVRVVSVNTRKEIDLLVDESGYERVVFVERDEAVDGKYQKIDAMTDVMRRVDADRFVLINSDILMRGDGFMKKLWTERPIIGIRNDLYKTGRTERFPYGYDVFGLTRRHLGMLTGGGEYTVGRPWWDFWVPLRLMECGEEWFVGDKESFVHRWHKTRYSYRTWCELAAYSRERSCFTGKELGDGGMCTVCKERIDGRIVG